MRGVAQAEWLRFRKRRVLLLIVFAVPLLAGFIFLAGYASTGNYLYPFDPAEIRARIIAEGYLAGLPPDEAEAIIVEAIESERVFHEEQLRQVALDRARYASPQSIVMLLSNGMFVFVALVLLTALSIGDEFGWGTVRTALLASSHRRLLLFLRLVTLALAAGAMLALLVLLGVILPVALTVAGAPLPRTQALDPVGLIVLLSGELLISIMVIAFAALVTLMIRSGSLTLVAVLVYVLVETAAIGLLTRLESFQENGVNEWLLDAFPVRAILTLMDVAVRATGRLPSYEGEFIVRDLTGAQVPFAALLLWAGLFAALAFRRFSRMDIVE